MQLKRWIVNARKVSEFASSDSRLRVFFLYLRLCFLKDLNKESEFSPVILNLFWNNRTFEFLVREKLDFDALLHIFTDIEYTQY